MQSPPDSPKDIEFGQRLGSEQFTEFKSSAIIRQHIARKIDVSHYFRSHSVTPLFSNPDTRRTSMIFLCMIIVGVILLMTGTVLLGVGATPGLYIGLMGAGSVTMFGPFIYLGLNRLLKDRCANSSVVIEVMGREPLSKLTEEDQKTIQYEAKTLGIMIEASSSLSMVQYKFDEEKPTMNKDAQETLAVTLSEALAHVGIFSNNPVHRHIMEYSVHNNSAVQAASRSLRK